MDKWVTIYTGPEPFGMLYDEYREALTRLQNNDSVVVTAHPVAPQFFHLTFRIFLPDYDPPDPVKEAIFIIQTLLDPEYSMPDINPGYCDHPAFDNLHIPIHRRVSKSVTWSDKEVDEWFDKHPTSNAESEEDFVYRQTRRKATQDLVEYHLNGHGFTIAALADYESHRFIVNLNPQSGFRYDSNRDGWSSKTPSQSCTISFEDFVSWDEVSYALWPYLLNPYRSAHNY